jgi:acyl-coenzyme A thioesterase PaaI-like protein
LVHEPAPIASTRPPGVAPHDLLPAARELATAVRELAIAVGAVEAPADDLRRAAAAIRAVTAEFDGPRRPRWWEAGASDVAPTVPPGRGFRHRSMFQGELNPVSLHLRWVDAEGPNGEPGLAAHLSVDELHEGPPRSVHGGYVAGLFDEVLGAVQGRAPGGGGFTGRLVVRYRALTPLDEELAIAGWVASSVGRRIVTRGSCTVVGTGKVTADAEALFVRPPTDLG